MGAHPFEHHVKTKATAREAYAALRDEAGHEDGFGGYSGTIATTHGVRVVQAEPVTEAKAERIMERRVERCEKWGDAEAVATYQPLAKHVRKVTRKVKVSAEQLAKHENLRAAIHAALDAFGATLVREGEELDRAEVTQNRDGLFAKANVEYRSKVTSVVTEGAKQTRYFVTGDYRQPEWREGHATLAAAKAELTKQLASRTPDYRGEVTYGIIAQTRREDGQPLTVVKQQVVGATVECEFTFVKKVAAPERTGWLIYGMAAS